MNENFPESQDFSRTFTIDLQNSGKMDIIAEHATLFYANPDFALDMCILCTAVTLLVYAIARVQGRIRTRVHGGLHLFWTCLMMGDVAVCLTCVAATALTYFRNNGRPESVTCIDISPINRYYAYLWLLLWGIFVVAVLRSTVAITWLNRIRNIERLADMGRGVGILCLALIYLFPLALISRQNADAMTTETAPVTACLPAFERSTNIDTVICSTVVAWFAAILLAVVLSGRVSENRRTSRLAVPLAVLTHFLPTMLLFVLITNVTYDVIDLRDTLPATYAALTAVSAICNFCTYKLFPLATEDAEIAHNGGGGDVNGMEQPYSITDIIDGNTKCKEQLLEFGAPPAYSENVSIV